MICGCIKAKHSTSLLEQEQILERWDEYIEDLFYDDRGEKPRISKPVEGQPILKEVRHAI